MPVVLDSLSCSYLVMDSCAGRIAGLPGCAGHFGFMIDMINTGARGAGPASSVGPAGRFDLCFHSQS